MRFAIPREVLLKPLQQVVSVTEKRQTMPVLANVFIQVSAGELILTATDTELEMQGRIPAQVVKTGK